MRGEVIPKVMKAEVFYLGPFQSKTEASPYVLVRLTVLVAEYVGALSVFSYP